MGNMVGLIWCEGVLIGPLGFQGMICYTNRLNFSKSNSFNNILLDFLSCSLKFYQASKTGIHDICPRISLDILLT